MFWLYVAIVLFICFVISALLIRKANRDYDKGKRHYEADKY